MTQANKPSFGDIIAAAALVVGLATAWLYTAGWTYAYHFFAQFHIPLLMVDVPRDHILVYGGAFVRQSPLLAIGGLLAFAGAFWLMARFRTSIRQSGTIVATVVILVAMFALARQAGVHAARAEFDIQRAGDFPSFPRIAFEPKVATAANDALLEALARCGRLVLATERGLFLIRPRRDSEALGLHTHLLRWDQVGTLTITDEYESCA